MPKIHDITGRKFGRLTIISMDSIRTNSGQLRWLCRCDCGTEKVITGDNLKIGHTSSCGCFAKEASRKRMLKHGKEGSSIYRCWLNMRSRCYNKKDISYSRYGGRGITVCPRWDYSFNDFYLDMGDIPADMSIDRIDNDGDYSPDNCKWSTRTEQANNRRRSKLITHDGETLSHAEWSRRLGGCIELVGSRLRKGWTEEEAILTPKALRTAQQT